MIKGFLAGKKSGDVSSKHSDPASGPSSAPHKTQKTHDEAVDSLSALPPYHDVLTGAGKPFELPQDKRGMFAVLETADNLCYLIGVAHGWHTQEHRSLTQLVGKKYAITREILVSAAVIDAVYRPYESTHATKGKRNAHDEKRSPSRILFEEIVLDALRRRATDIHFCVRPENYDSAAILFRINGRIIKQNTYAGQSALIQEAVAAGYQAIGKEHSDPTFMANKAQQCIIPIEDKNLRIQLRYQSTPVVDGFDVVLRLLVTNIIDDKPLTLSQLGYSPSQIREIELVSRKSVGAILLAGITGSGKSTTLKTLMTMSPQRHKKKSYSVEHPAEYKMYGVSQISVQDHDSFHTAIRHLLRLDPDIIMPGEIRDAETAEFAHAMALTGHQIMSTIHASSAMAVFERFTEDSIGLSRHSISGKDVLNCIIYQRLIPSLCPHCKQGAIDAKDENGEYIMPDDRLLLLASMGLDINKIKIAKESGCPECNHMGVDSLTVAAEVLTMNREFLRCIRDGMDAEAEDIWLKRCAAPLTDDDCTGKLAIEHAIYKVSIGTFDPRDVEDAFEPFEIYLSNYGTLRSLPLNVEAESVLSPRRNGTV